MCLVLRGSIVRGFGVYFHIFVGVHCDRMHAYWRLFVWCRVGGVFRVHFGIWRWIRRRGLLVLF